MSPPRPGRSPFARQARGPRPRLVAFARAPRIGAGKRRLAASVGDVAAWRIARAMTARTLRATYDPRWECRLAITPDAAAGLAASVWPPAWARAAQGAGDLGARLERALDRLGPTLVIGTDAPDVRAADIAAAFAALRRRPFVFGPAADGGFWLIGARRPLARGVLNGVRWSTAHALADALAALRPAGEAALLRRLRDVDTLPDWRALNAARPA